MKKKTEKYTTSRWSLKKPLYLEKTDKRYKRHVKELKKFGFSDSETWSLDSVVSEFVLPRLKRFKEIVIDYCHPGGIDEKEWEKILDQMIFAFEWNLTCDNDKNIDLDEKAQKANWDKYIKGMELFAKHFRELWW